jgi:glycosyltransferase involved in cell wall biosynthesis
MKLGVVVIGRNEGERLQRCLDSILGYSSAIVFVDSGSTDDSVTQARRRGVTVVNLDTAIPFTAARARNAGFERLCAEYTELELVQFVDGDCELAQGWLEAAEHDLQTHPEAAATCGRLRERRRQATVYNRLCDMEWNGPAGEIETCGGNVCLRTQAFQACGGFRETLIAGEEPELCVRLRLGGWVIRRIAADMGLHDAAMTRFGQWWKRSIRNGHAFAECSWLHRKDAIRLWTREARSNWLWGLLLPLMILALLPHSWYFLLGFLAYPLLALRIFRYRRRLGDSIADSGLYAVFCVLSKLPLALGQLRFHAIRLRGRQSRLIEYKEIRTPVPQEVPSSSPVPQQAATSSQRRQGGRA